MPEPEVPTSSVFPEAERQLRTPGALIYGYHRLQKFRNAVVTGEWPLRGVPDHALSCAPFFASFH